MGRWRSLHFDFVAMASPCSLQIDGQDEPAMRRAAALAIAEVQRIEAKYSRYRPDSIVGQINQAAGKTAVRTDDETCSLLDFAQSLWQLSGGAFDITSGVLRKAWDFKTGVLPTQESLQTLLPLVGWQNVERSGNQVRLTRPGMELDFGGFGKEYAVDRAAAILHNQGLRHALVNLGGDLHALAERGLPALQGAPWQVEIQHPRANAKDGAQNPHALAFLALTRGGLATSGDYERFFIRDGKRYCHVLHPGTGWPVEYWQSVSVLAANATVAGALCTIAMLKGADAIDWLAAQGVRYLAVRQDGRLMSNTVDNEISRRS